MPAPLSESSSAVEGVEGDDEWPFTGFSSSSSDEDDNPPNTGRPRRSTTRDDLLDDDHDVEHPQAATHALPNTPNTTPPTDAAGQARPSEEEEAPEADGSSPKKNRSGRPRYQMPYKPRRYKGRRSR